MKELNNPCSHCKKREAIHTDSEQSLCEVCMDEFNLVWNPDYLEFCNKHQKCHSCGGEEVWCSSCERYTCHGCNDYGTCQCS